MSATTDVTRVKRALRKWLSLALVGTAAEDRVIFGQQGKPRMERPYCDVTLSSVASRGRDERRTHDNAGERHVVGPRVVMATVQLFGPDAMGLGEQARAGLYLEAVRALLHIEAVSFMEADPVQNITTSIETEIEERAVFAARFAYASDQTETVGWIEHVEVEAVLEDEAGTTVEDTTYWVPESPA